MNISTNKSKYEFGISTAVIKAIISTICLNKKVEEIIIFGSRAKGNFKKGSDIDLAIVANDLSYGELLEIKTNISELPFPYNIDIVNFGTLKNIELIEHINRVGKKLKASKNDKI